MSRTSERGPLLGPTEARRLFEYNERVFRRFVRKLRGLPWRVVRRRREIGHQSLFDTLVHILNVHEVWVGYILQGRNSDPELEALFADKSRHPKDWAGFDRYQRRVWKMVNGYLDGVSGADLAKEVQVFWMPGRYLAADGLLQTTFEQGHHLGEVIAALWQDDIEPPEMTWIGVGRAGSR